MKKLFQKLIGQYLPWTILFTGFFAISAMGAATVLFVPEGGTGVSVFTGGAYPIVSAGGAGTGALSASGTPVVLSINATSTTATSTFAGGLQATQFRDSSIDCSGLSNGGKITTNAAGYFVCAADTSGSGAVTLNTGTADRFAYYSATDAIDSFNGLITGSDGTGSTTIASNLTVTSIFASSTGRFSGAFTLDSTLGVTGTSTLVGVSAGFGTFSENIVGAKSLNITATSTLAGLSAGFGTFSQNLVASKLLNVTGVATFSASITAAGGMTLTCTDCITDTNVSDTLTASDLVAGSSVVADTEVDNDLTISGGVIDNSIIGGSTAAAGTFTTLTVNTSGDFSGASLEIPNGTGPTVNAIGEIAWDTTSGNLIIATSTDATSAVLASATSTLYAFVLASTSPELVSGGIFNLPDHWLAQHVIGVRCSVDGGTSVVINLSDDGTNDTNATTCSTTEAQHGFTSNNDWIADEAIRLEVGTVTGSPDYLIMRFVGYRSTD